MLDSNSRNANLLRPVRPKNYNAGISAGQDATAINLGLLAIAEAINNLAHVLSNDVDVEGNVNVQEQTYLDGSKQTVA